MGLLDWMLGRVPTAATYAPASPWTPSALDPNVIIGEAFGQFQTLASRENAIQIPAIAKARHLIASTLAAAVWAQYRGETKVATQPSWLYRTNGQMTPQHRMMWTADDLLFYGWSLWAVQRGTESQILDASRVPRERWDFDVANRIEVDGEIVNDDEVVLIPGPFEGLLTAGRHTIHGAMDLEAQWSARVRNPIAITELHNTDANDPLTNDEAKALVATFNAARQTQDGVTTYTPANIELRVHGAEVVDLFIAGRNASAVDVARLTGLPAVMLDAANVNAANQTYTSKESARNDLIDSVRNVWALPIEARLSMDDVCPRGTSVRADLGSQIEIPQSPTSAPRED